MNTSISTSISIRTSTSTCTSLVAKRLTKSCMKSYKRLQLDMYQVENSGLLRSEIYPGKLVDIAIV